MRVKLIQHQSDAVSRVVEAAQTCRRSLRDMTEGEAAVFINNLLTRGHMTPFEFTEYSFLIEGMSRVASHQLVRHRHLSFQQESHRAVQSLGFYLPPAFEHLQNAEIIEEILAASQAVYEKLVAEGMKREDARYILPQATTSTIMVRGSARAWLEFLEVRCCKQTQEELRDCANQIAMLLKNLHPVIFYGAGPNCGACWNRERCK